MEFQTLKIVLFTIATTVAIQLVFLYLRSIYIKYVTGSDFIFNPFKRVSDWANKDWIQGELFGRASTIQRYGLTKYCAESDRDLEAVKEIERWEENRDSWDSILGSKPNAQEPV